jgi:predicted nucleic acid-binding protein
VLEVENGGGRWLTSGLRAGEAVSRARGASLGIRNARYAELLRAAIALPAVRVLDAGTLLRALELYEVVRLDFPEAYLAASAEVTGVGTVASFDRSLDRVKSVRRLEP